MRPAISTRSPQRGSQLVELALVLPIFLVLGLIVAEGAGVVRAHQVLNNAAREGARLSILPHNQYPVACDAGAGCTCDAACVEAALKDRVIAYASNNGLPGVTAGQITIRQDCQIPVSTTGSLGCQTGCGSTCFTATQVTVTFPYQLTYLPRLPWISQPTTVSLTAQSQFRNLY